MAIEVIYYFVLLCLGIVALGSAALLVFAARYIGQRDRARRQAAAKEQADMPPNDESVGV